MVPLILWCLVICGMLNGNKSDVGVTNYYVLYCFELQKNCSYLSATRCLIQMGFGAKFMITWEILTSDRFAFFDGKLIIYFHWPNVCLYFCFSVPFTLMIEISWKLSMWLELTFVQLTIEAIPHCIW